MAGQGRPRTGYAAVLAVLLYFLTGCAAFRAGQRPPADATTAEAGALYATLRGINDTLHGFKALGTIRLQQGGIDQRFRSAWAAGGGGRLRVDVLGIAGQPMFSFSCDGSNDYVLLYQEGRLIRRRAGGAAFMDRLVHIPIDAADLFALLSGRPGKSEDFFAIRLEKDPLEGTVLVLWNKRDGARSRILLVRKPLCIREIERTDSRGHLVWRAEFRGMKERDGYRVPTDLRLTGPDGVQVRITTDRFWANPRMPADLFILETLP
jgi:hypothetical protein